MQIKEWGWGGCGATAEYVIGMEPTESRALLDEISEDAGYITGQILGVNGGRNT